MCLYGSVDLEVELTSEAADYEECLKGLITQCGGVPSSSKAKTAATAAPPAGKAHLQRGNSAPSTGSNSSNIHSGSKAALPPTTTSRTAAATAATSGTNSSRAGSRNSTPKPSPSPPPAEAHNSAAKPTDDATPPPAASAAALDPVVAQRKGLPVGVWVPPAFHDTPAAAEPVAPDSDDAAAAIGGEALNNGSTEPSSAIAPAEAVAAVLSGVTPFSGVGVALGSGASAAEEEVERTLCGDCGVTVPTANFAMHSVRCKRNAAYHKTSCSSCGASVFKKDLAAHTCSRS